MNAPTPGQRVCGECTLCCTVLRVDELGKLGGTPCRHLRREGAGCSIHPTRPEICRAYRCLWLRGAFRDEDRPDRLGAVLDFMSQGGTVILAVREAAAGAFDRSPRLQEIAEEQRKAVPVRITSAEDVLNPDRPYRLLLPDGEEHLVEGERIQVTRVGRPPEVRRMPWLERRLRGWMLRFARWRLRRGSLE